MRRELAFELRIDSMQKEQSEFEKIAENNVVQNYQEFVS